MLKNKKFCFALVLLAAYWPAGYFAGPMLLQPGLEEYVSQRLGRELQFERLRVNPLTWTVQMESVDLAPGEESLWPGLSISAASVALRFSFRGLTPVVSVLTLQEPLFVLDNTNVQLEADPYPFIELWQQWQEGINTEAGQQAVPVESWHVDAGRLLIRNASSTATADVLLDSIALDAHPQAQDGLREYSLTFSVADTLDISSQGLFRSAYLTATGRYQLTAAPATNGSMAALQAAGAFSGDFLTDALRIELRENQLRTDHIATCLLDGLLCAAITPLEASFDSSVLVASNGIQVLQATAGLGAFRLDASLGEDDLSFADQQEFASGRIELGLPPAGSPDGANQEMVRNFVIALNAADNDQYQIEGQLDLVSHTAQARFQVDGRHNISGRTQLRNIGRQQAQAAHSRLDLQLENPAASLAQAFMNENLTTGVAAATLQLQLGASVDELGLKLQETIILEQARTAPNARPGSSADTTPVSSAALDTEWLLALLQSPDGLIELRFPEHTLDSTTDTSLGEVIRRQSLSMLTDLSRQPFSGLARALNVNNQSLDEIRFAPGSAALDATSTETLADVAGILIQRPGLGITVAGVYDPLIDKKALQTEQLRTHIALAMAADLAFRTGAEPPDFRDPIVHSVIDEFARRRVPADVMEKFTEQYGHADADQGVLPEGDITAYYTSLFELLVDYAEIPQSAMTSLARYRAQAVMDGLEDAGISRERLETAAQATSTEGTPGGVALPVQLIAWAAGNGDSSIPDPLSPEDQPETLQEAEL